ncbi:uncharacterized protein [Clytia hemisphaerica]|uniref:Potassium channel domain-containing protein n=1 Tax=Clytia hemisphaerica TaxID=252671 RepID=A0A7M5X579_9CNID|eukprot:TCONS_00052259-protein
MFQHCNHVKILIFIIFITSTFGEQWQEPTTKAPVPKAQEHVGHPGHEIPRDPTTKAPIISTTPKVDDPVITNLAVMEAKTTTAQVTTQSRALKESTKTQGPSVSTSIKINPDPTGTKLLPEDLNHGGRRHIHTEYGTVYATAGPIPTKTLPTTKEQASPTTVSPKVSTADFFQTLPTSTTTVKTKRPIKFAKQEHVRMSKADVKQFMRRSNREKEQELILCGINDRKYLEAIKEHIGKEEVVKYNSLCGANITVAFSELPPLVYTNETDRTVHGILPELLKEGLIDRCCLGYNNLHFIRKTYSDKFVDQFRPLNESQIVLPVENNKDEGLILGFKYSPLIHFKSIKFFSKKQEKGHVEILRNLAQSTLETWPLFVVAMALTLLAGTIIWIMENMTNSKEFPKRFPHGIFDGFWWAFISMTTVGYGDKSPLTFLGRTFAVFWIVIGITITSLYVATLTSVLTMELSGERPLIISGKNVGVLSNPVHTMRAVKLHRGIPIRYASFEDMMRALKKGNIEAFAIDDMTYKIKADDISRLGNDVKVGIEHKFDSQSIGFTAINETLIMMNKAFLEAYMDAPNIEINKELIDSGMLEKKPVQLFSANDKRFIKIIIVAFPAIFLFGIVGLLLIKIKDCTFGSGTSHLERIIMESKEPGEKLKYR